MSNVVPEKMNNFTVYIDGEEQSGIAEGNFPSGQFMTSEIRGGGVAGIIESPGLGHMQSMTVELTWRSITDRFIDLMIPEGHELDMYSEMLAFDAGRGEYVSKSVNIYMKAVTKEVEFGRLVVNDSSDTKSTHEVYYMKMFVDGVEVIELDKYNFVYKVRGTDYFAQTRRALGKQ
ncbi:MAG: phage major tail tube protein [Synergistaceae bacterium]|nr:phage major tail tube protein [Synergistaceae bacterium]MBQ7168429.1 phage major tail tube protein [Synergistaceae bacterium]